MDDDLKEGNQNDEVGKNPNGDENNPSIGIKERVMATFGKLIARGKSIPKPNSKTINKVLILLVFLSMVFNGFQIASLIIKKKAEHERNEYTYDMKKNFEKYGVAKSIPILVYQNIIAGEEEMEEQGKKEENGTAYNNFKDQMKYLATYAYYTLSKYELAEFITGKKTFPANSVMLTFDGGNASIYEQAYPLLGKYKFKSMCFFTPRLIPEYSDEGEQQLLTWQDVMHMKETTDFGVIIKDLHGADRKIDEYSQESIQNKLKEDLNASRVLSKSDNLAYTDGKYNQLISNISKETGYEMAFTLEPRKVVKGEDLFRIPRIRITNEITLEKFSELVKPS